MHFKQTDHPLTFTSILVNENSHKSRHVLVIKEPCLSRHLLVIVMKKGGVNEIILSSLTKTTLVQKQLSCVGLTLM